MSSMNMIINDKDIAIVEGETLLETAKRAGYEIPTLCYAKDAVHKSSCMVCAVKNRATGQIIPACTTRSAEGMEIETESEEVRQIRVLSLELLLSDHRADCEAPCSLVCPQGFNVELMLRYYDDAQFEKAYQVLMPPLTPPKGDFSSTPSPWDRAGVGLTCNTCKAPCEKACRRGMIDNAVSIREIIRKIVGMFDPIVSDNEKLDEKKAGLEMENRKTDNEKLGLEKSNRKSDNKIFQSRLGRFTTNERERLKTSTTTPSRCLHCACAGSDNCKLRIYATSEGIKRPRYEASSALPVMNKQHVNGKIWFEQAKCIRCGLCVYNSTNGFTFKNRGFGMQIVLPDENRMNIKNELVTLCPTGALYINDIL